MRFEFRFQKRGRQAAWTRPPDIATTRKTRRSRPFPACDGTSAERNAVVRAGLGNPHRYQFRPGLDLAPRPAAASNHRPEAVRPFDLVVAGGERAAPTSSASSSAKLSCASSETALFLFTSGMPLWLTAVFLRIYCQTSCTSFFNPSQALLLTISPAQKLSV